MCDPSNDHDRADKGITGKVKDILIAMSVIVLPMLLFSAILLGFVFNRRVRHAPSEAVNLRLPQNEGESSAYYVKMSATTFVFIASWSSSAAPLLSGFIMLLLSFPIASGLLKGSDANDARRLPTPYQLSMLIGLMGGGVVWLWHYVTYAFGWFGWKSAQAKTIPLVKFGAIARVLTFVFAILILAADTWLHIATKAVLFEQVQPRTTAANEYGRGIYQYCVERQIDRNSTDDSPCNVSYAATNTFLIGADEAYRTLGNISSDNRARQTTRDGKTYVYLGEATIPSDVDFTASTVAAMTQCRPVSRECNLTAVSGASTLFRCSGSYGGHADAVDNIHYFDDRDATVNASRSVTTNPFFFGYSKIADVGGYDIFDDPEMITPVHGGLAFVIYCNATVYEVQYSWVNGSVVSFDATETNTSMAKLVRAPMLYRRFAENFLGEAATVAALSNTSQELADKFSTSYSQAAMALAAGVFSRRRNVEEQVRSSFLVARVPKPPLYVLVGLNLLFAAVGLVLGAIALALAGGRGRGRDRIKDVQAHLDFRALTAQLLEPRAAPSAAPFEPDPSPVSHIEDLFAERRGAATVRVGIHQTGAAKGRWAFASMES